LKNRLFQNLFDFIHIAIQELGFDFIDLSLKILVLARALPQGRWSLAPLSNSSFFSRSVCKRAKVIHCKPLELYHVWVEFKDGLQGEVDLSHLANQEFGDLMKTKSILILMFFVINFRKNEST